MIMPALDTRMRWGVVLASIRDCFWRFVERSSFDALMLSRTSQKPRPATDHTFWASHRSPSNTSRQIFPGPQRPAFHLTNPLMSHCIPAFSRNLCCSSIYVLFSQRPREREGGVYYVVYVIIVGFAFIFFFGCCCYCCCFCFGVVGLLLFCVRAFFLAMGWGWG